MCRRSRSPRRRRRSPRSGSATSPSRRGTSSPSSPMHAVARAAPFVLEQTTLQTSDDAYLIHEYLERHSEPFYLHELVARAARHGLEYLGDGSTFVPFPQLSPPPLAAALREHE